MRPWALAAAALLGCGSGTTLPDQTVFGGDRPAELRVPADLDPDQPTPLLVVLHGYGINGVAELAYTRLINLVDDPGIFVIAPDGSEDVDGNLFWSTGDQACAIGAGTSLPDDHAYLTGLIDEVSAVWNVDPARIYLFGHSNGAFMAQALACRDPARYAAVISLAGAPPLDPSACAPDAPLGFLEIHGDADDTVLYGGGDDILGVSCPYPGAIEAVGRWALHDGCTSTVVGDPIDLDVGLTGAETAVERHSGCDGGFAVDLWTIAGGGHVPSFRNDVQLALWSFLQTQVRP